jgi:hypothetical protein
MLLIVLFGIRTTIKDLGAASEADEMLYGTPLRGIPAKFFIENFIFPL